MSLREQLFQQAGEALPQRVAYANGSNGHTSAAYQQVAQDVHQIIIDRVELSRLQHLTPEQIKRELAQLVEQIVDEGKHQLNESERRRLVSDVQDEMLGYGPLEPLLADPTVSDILVNTHQYVYVERRGKLELTSVTFHDDAHLMRVIEKMVSRVGRRIDESSPMVDARLPDGSRINAIIPPSAIDGPLLSIRRFSVNPLTIQDLINFRTMTPEMAQLLDAMVKAKLNILISGGTGSGKTTLLNILSGYIPSNERIVTIEDAAELQLRQNHVLRLETRPANIEGRGEITQRSLVKNALRMRPDRIILGEVRGAEALDMLHAMNTGHEGSLATIHANTPRDALTRLENMVSMAGLQLPPKTMRQQITSALTVVVQVTRLTDGNRKLVSVQEITGMEGEVVNMQEIFTFRRKGIDADGRIKGHFCATGVRPKFSERLQAFGIHLPETLYDPSVQYEV
ncbi:MULTISPECIES: CpaF family protein [Ralstonia]|uniref:CpaF family protein n=1 Tax=Ralstonia TaxID=48736 RepID=UPI0020910061|nr:CpaF family protein [Ralstonia mojiangensis]MCO5413282.1 CpaF family protein [Ralstonia mojiangensis]